MPYRLIDTDTREIVATGPTEATVLEHTPYLPSDCMEGAANWQDVVDEGELHADGLLGLVYGYAVELADE